MKKLWVFLTTKTMQNILDKYESFRKNRDKQIKRD